MFRFVGIVVVLVCWYCVCVVVCQLCPFWPRILFGFRLLQSGIVLLGIFLSIKFNSITDDACVRFAENRSFWCSGT